MGFNVKSETKITLVLFFFLFQTHKNEEESSGNPEERGEKTDVAISFVFGQNIKDRAKVG